MAVEIVILSGNRQGQRFETDSHTFRAGGTQQCDLSFDAELDPGAKDRAVFFRLEDDGWKIRSVGTTGVLINSAVVQGDTRLRSGDIIRLSPQGPDFSFNIVSRSAGARAKRVAFPTISASAPEPRSQALAEFIPSESSTNAGRSHLVAWTTAAAALLLIVSLVGWRLFGSKSPPEFVATVLPVETAPPSSDPAKPGRVTPIPPSPREPIANPHQPTPESVNAPRDQVPAELPTAEAPGPADPWAPVLKKLQDATFLLTAEHTEKHKTWPITTACAVGEKTLLTSASMAIELAKFRPPDWKLWAINERLGIKAEIQSLRVHVGYAKSTGEPEQQIYFDLALIYVAEKLKAMVTLADTKDLNELDSGFPLGCVDIPHKFELMSRFQSTQPELLHCTILVVTSLEPPAGPRLLHLKGDFPSKPYGGFLVDAEEKVYAVFAETSSEEGGNGLILHYAPVVNRELVKLGLDAGKSEIWVPPTIPESTDKP